MQRPEQRFCPKCGLPMTWQQHRKSAKSEYFRWKCQKCQRLSSSHGMRFDDFQAMVDAQQGGCAICGAVDELVIDHDHSCCPPAKSCHRCRRGLLCHMCNRMLGLGKDQPQILLMAAAYLLTKQPSESA